MNHILIAAVILLVLSNFNRAYYLSIASLFLFFVYAKYGLKFVHVIIFAMFFSLIANQEKSVKPAGNKKYFFNRLPLLLLIWVNLSLLWGPHISECLLRIIDVFTIALVYWLSIYFIDEESKVRKVFLTWAIAGFIFTLFRLFVPSATPSPEITTPSDLSNKNLMSSLLNFSFFSFIALIALKDKTIPKTASYIAIVIILAANYILGSKGGLISLIFGFILYLFIVDFKESRMKRFFLNAATWFVTVFLIAQIFLVPLVYTKLGSMSLPLILPDFLQTIDFRIMQWDYAKQMIEEHGNMLMGVGLDGYSTYYWDTWDYEWLPQRWMYQPHSLFVYFYVDYGLIGLTLFLTVVVALFWILRSLLIKSKNQPLRLAAYIVYASIFTYMIHALIDGSIYDKRLWFFIGLGTALTLIDRNLGYLGVPLIQKAKTAAKSVG